MADIRTTPLLDDFQRPPENPVQPPWHQSPFSNFSMELTGDPALKGIGLPPNENAAYLETPFGPVGDPEMWAKAFGDAPVTEGWRFGMFTIESVAVGERRGYICLPHNNVGTDTWSLRKYTGFTFVQIHSVNAAPLGLDVLALMRIKNGLIETWRSDDDGANWTLHNQVADPGDYVGPWYFVLGSSGHNEGWTEIGGGRTNRQHMYRWQSA